MMVKTKYASWTIRSISHVYEPGSTFKLVTAAALLDAHKVTPVDSFDAERGRGTIGSFTIADTHPHDKITFEDAFVYSSNIVMYKASSLISSGDFFGKFLYNNVENRNHQYTDESCDEHSPKYGRTQIPP